MDHLRSVPAVQLCRLSLPTLAQRSTNASRTGWSTVGGYRRRMTYSRKETIHSHHRPSDYRIDRVTGGGDDRPLGDRQLTEPSDISVRQTTRRGRVSGNVRGVLFRGIVSLVAVVVLVTGIKGGLATGQSQGDATFERVSRSSQPTDVWHETDYDPGIRGVTSGIGRSWHEHDYETELAGGAEYGPLHTWHESDYDLPR